MLSPELPSNPAGHKKVVMKGVSPACQTPSDEESRFAEIYKEYGKLLHAYCARRTLATQSADAVAEVFLVAWKRIDQGPSRSGRPPLALWRGVSGYLPSMAIQGTKPKARMASRHLV
jgi:hypothetical protein